MGWDAEMLRLVLLTHIPPFMDSFDEPEGWANWRQVYRKQILDAGCNAGGLEHDAINGDFQWDLMGI